MSSTVDVATLRAKIEAAGADKAKKDLKDVGDEADKAKGRLSGMGGGFATLKNAFMGGLGAITGAITGFLGYKVVGDVLGFVKDQLLDVMQAGMDQQKVIAQTEAVIKSTGGAAGMSADQIGDMADSLARMSGISDDTIQSAENILLTFKAIGKDVFPQATQAVLDMSVGLHQDLQTSAIAVGKALQDPILGVTALRRVGVQLTDQQVQLVKQFMATGQKAKAQAVIIGELTSEFGGSAKAAGQTFPGELARPNVAFDQAKEKIGLAVIPVLESLLNKYVMPLADWMGEHLPAAITVLTTFLDNQLVPAINDFMNSPVVKTVESWAQSITGTLQPALDDKKGLTHSANQATAALGEKGMAGAGNKASGSLRNVGGGANQAGKDVDGFVTHVNQGITQVLNLTDAIDPKGAGDTKSHALVPAMRRAQVQFDQLDAAQKKSQKSSSDSIPVISGIGDFFGMLGDKVGQAGAAIGQFVDDVKSRFPAAEPIISDVLHGILQNFIDFGPGLQNIVEGLAAFLSAPFRAGFDLLHGIVNVGLDILGHQFDRAGDDIKTALGNIWGDIQDMFAGLGRFLVGVGQTLLNLMLFPFKTLWATISPFLGRAKDSFIQWWNDLIPELKKTIDNWSHMIQQYINDHMPHFPAISLPWGGQQRAKGGPTSGPFLGAEEGMELLVTPGIYHAPPGSYVYNNAQTRDILSGSGSGGATLRGGVTNVYNITATSNDQNTARAIERTMRRRALLTGMGV